MDNLTHSLMGATVAELAHQSLQPLPLERDNQRRRRFFYVASILANNFPDFDLLYDRWLAPEPLGYLLYHRGHTHTIGGLLPQLLLILLFLKLLTWRDNLLRQTWMQITAVSAFGLCLHIFADSFNSYGVHPFYPLNSNWYFGDSVFIVEPVLWSFMATALALTARVKHVRWLLLGFIQILPIFLFLFHFLHLYSFIALLVLNLSLFFGLHFLATQKRVAMAAVLVLLYVGLQFFLAQSAKVTLRAMLSPLHTEVIDLALTPLPANPLCYSVLTVESDGVQYISRSGMFSAWPSILTPAACPRLLLVKEEQIAIAGLKKNPSIDWLNEFRLPITEFRSLVQDKCLVKAWFGFARVPEIQNGILTDRRFGALGGANFTAFDSRSKDGCLQSIPPWLTPFAERLLR